MDSSGGPNIFMTAEHSSGRPCEDMDTQEVFRPPLLYHAPAGNCKRNITFSPTFFRIHAFYVRYYNILSNIFFDIAVVLCLL